MKNWIDKRGGLSIIKTNENKIPMGKWKEHSIKQNTISDWYSHFKSGGSVGIVCGSVSGNLEVIDIDTKNDPTKKIATDYGSLIPEDIKGKILMSKTPSGGFHFIYRCPECIIDKSMELAKHTDGAVIIETRGDTGYINHNKKYKLVKGGKINLIDLEVDIPEITPEERDTLFTIARSLNRYFERKTKGNGENFKYDKEYINEFNKNFNIIPLMVEKGWEETYDDGERVSLKRPGETSALHSAYYFKDSNLLYVHSTSTSFRAQQPYNNFQIVQELLFKDDTNSYTKSLSYINKLGYEDKKEDKKKIITSSDILNRLREMDIYRDLFTQLRYYNGNRITDMYINDILLELRDFFGKEISKKTLKECIKSSKIKTKHGLKDFIKENEHRLTTGVFDKWFNGIKTKEHIDRDDLKYFVKKWYIGLLAQALDGENPNEFFLSLISNEQGIGKTYFLRNFILPKELSKKYVVEASLANTTDFKKMMSKNLLIFDDEMDGKSYQENATFKCLMSMNEMDFRIAYGEEDDHYKRRCSFAGSGNELDVIKENNNRRIIPIEVERFDTDILKNIDYNDLFMEMYNEYKKGTRYTFEMNDKMSFNGLYEDYKQQTDLDLIIDEMIDFSDYKPRFIKTIDMVKVMKENYKDYKISSTTLGKFLSRRGCKLTKKQIEGKRNTGYYISSKSVIFEYLDFQELNINTIMNKQTNLN